MNKDTRRGPTNPVKGLLYFAVLGPPIGGAILAFLTFFRGDWMELASSRGPLAVLNLLGVTIFAFSLWSYFLGLVPAAITGAIAGLMRKRLIQWRYCLVIGAVGAIASSGPAVLFVLSGQAGYEFILGLIVCGFMSALVTSRIFSMRAKA